MNERVCKIEYPCLWKYKVIGSDQERMRGAIAKIVGEQEYTLTLSRSSKGGKYYSLNLQINIDNDEIRLEIYEALRKNPAIKFVL